LHSELSCAPSARRDERRVLCVRKRRGEAVRNAAIGDAGEF